MRKTVPLSSVVPVLRSPASSSPVLSTGKPSVVQTTQALAPGRDETTCFATSSILTMARPDGSWPVTTRRICRVISGLLGSRRQHRQIFRQHGQNLQQSRVMQLRVRSITYLAEAINGYELVDPRGRDLPRFQPGAHIELWAGGFLRRYSLWNDAAEHRHYCIAVLREDASRGGSRYLHENVGAGDIVEVSTPRNDFPLDPAAERHLLLAGGIGIAPIMSMVTELRRRGAEFEVHYCTRSPERAAFRRELAPLAADGRLCFHHDGGDPAQGVDIPAALREPRSGTHLYYCGPAP